MFALSLNLLIGCIKALDRLTRVWRLSIPIRAPVFGLDDVAVSVDRPSNILVEVQNNVMSSRSASGGGLPRPIWSAIWHAVLPPFWSSKGAQVHSVIQAPHRRSTFR